MKKFLVLCVVTFLVSCNNQNNKATMNIEELKQEIMATEKAFNNLAKEKGVKEAFLAFAADDAVLNRGGKAIKGKNNIEAYFNSQTLQNVSLQWKPDFVDVSTSGDMAYTYGDFTFKANQPDGKEITSEGIFHTVWKRQTDGSWKFVYD